MSLNLNFALPGKVHNEEYEEAEYRIIEDQPQKEKPWEFRYDPSTPDKEPNFKKEPKKPEEPKAKTTATKPTKVYDQLSTAFWARTHMLLAGVSLFCLLVCLFLSVKPEVIYKPGVSAEALPMKEILFRQKVDSFINLGYTIQEEQSLKTEDVLVRATPETDFILICSGPYLYKCTDSVDWTFFYGWTHYQDLTPPDSIYIKAEEKVSFVYMTKGPGATSLSGVGLPSDNYQVNYFWSKIIKILRILFCALFFVFLACFLIYFSRLKNKADLWNQAGQKPSPTPPADTPSFLPQHKFTDIVVAPKTDYSPGQALLNGLDKKSLPQGNKRLLVH